MVCLDYISVLFNRGMLLVILAVAWIMGILIDALLQLTHQIFLFLSGLILLFLIIFWRNQRDRLFLLLFLGMSLGAWRYAWALPQYDPQSLTRFVGTSSSLSVRGT